MRGGGESLLFSRAGREDLGWGAAAVVVPLLVRGTLGLEGRDRDTRTLGEERPQWWLPRLVRGTLSA